MKFIPIGRLLTTLKFSPFNYIRQRKERNEGRRKREAKFYNLEIDN
jgi:hypothetical protein